MGLLRQRLFRRLGWNKLVEVLDEGGYPRYDYKTADILLDITKKLQDQHDIKFLS